MSDYVQFKIFKALIEESEVLPTALSLCQDRMKNHVKEDVPITYMPGFGKHKDGNMGIWDLERSDKIWLKQQFSHTFLYWKRYKMLAVLDNVSSFVGAEQLKKEPLAFQNGCDQDYDYDYWDTILDDSKYRNDFKEVISEGQCSARRNIKNWLLKNSYYDEDDLALIDTYYRKVYVYKHIEQMLGIHDWLYGRPVDGLITFTLGDAFMNSETMCDISQAAVNLVNEFFNSFKNEEFEI